MIVITGKKSSCEAARDRILAIRNELVRECVRGVIPSTLSFSSLSLSRFIFQLSQANLKEAEVSIPAKLHNSLIGSKGSLVRSIMEECGGVCFARVMFI